MIPSVDLPKQHHRALMMPDGLFEFRDVLVGLSDDHTEFRLHLRPVGQTIPNPVRGLVQNLLHQGGVPAHRGGGLHGGERFLQKFGDLPALRRFRISQGTRIPLAQEQQHRDGQTEAQCDNHRRHSAHKNPVALDQQHDLRRQSRLLRRRGKAALIGRKIAAQRADVGIPILLFQGQGLHGHGRQRHRHAPRCRVRQRLDRLRLQHFTGSRFRISPDEVRRCRDLARLHLLQHLLRSIPFHRCAQRQDGIENAA